MAWQEHLEKEGLKDKGRVAVLAHKKEILGALEKGYSMTTIWRALRASDSMPIGYQAFLVHAKKLGAAAKTSAARYESQPKEQESKSTGFSFEPTPDKSKLLGKKPK